MQIAKQQTAEEIVGHKPSQYNTYTDDRIVYEWEYENGQGNKGARLKDTFTISVKCTREQALLLTRCYVLYFNVPCATHYDGEIWCGNYGATSMWCVDNSLRQRILDFVLTVTGKVGCDNYVDYD